MWKNVKTLVLGCVLLFVGVIIIPIATYIATRGLEAHDIRFTMPSEIEVAAQTDTNYSIISEFLNTFQVGVAEVDTLKSKYSPDFVDVIVNDYDSEVFLFWMKFGYISCGIVLSLLFSISGIFCLIMAYKRLTHRDPMGIQSERLITKKTATKGSKDVVRQKKASTVQKKAKPRSFMGMRS